VTERAMHLLLQDACPAIQYRLRKEILGESPSRPPMRALRRRILTDPRVICVFAHQQPDGYLGAVFHGAVPFYGADANKPRKSGNCGAEGSIRFLTEVGLDAGESRLRAALAAVLRPDWFREKHGWIQHYPRLGLYGGALLQALVLAYAGDYSELVAEQADQAAAALCGMINVRRMADITEDYKGRLVFKQGAVFPEIYHLKLLAFTPSWRTAELVRAVAAAVNRLIALSPLPIVKVRSGSRLLGPAKIYPSDLSRPLRDFASGDWESWFHTFELFARIGVVHRVPALQRQFEELMAILSGDWSLFETLTDPRFCTWGPYHGLALEPDWTNQSRLRDLLFRALLIAHHVDRAVKRGAD
jgi:hypothetical protein